MKFIYNNYFRNIITYVIAIILGFIGNGIYSKPEKTWVLIVYIILGIILLILGIIFTVIYTKSDKLKDDKILELENGQNIEISKLSNENKEIKESNVNLNRKFNVIFNAFKMFGNIFDSSAIGIYDIIKKARDTKKIDLNIWSHQNICDFVCEQISNLLLDISESGNDFSVNIIMPTSGKKLCMISHKSTYANIPKIFRQEISESKIKKYFFGDFFKERSSRDIKYLLNKEEIVRKFYFDKNDSKEKYSQYIGIPICCSEGQKIGLLQITADNNSIITKDETKINKIINEYLMVYSNFILFINKVETGISIVI